MWIAKLNDWDLFHLLAFKYIKTSLMLASKSPNVVSESQLFVFARDDRYEITGHWREWATSSSTEKHKGYLQAGGVPGTNLPKANSKKHAELDDKFKLRTFFLMWLTL